MQLFFFILFSPKVLGIILGAYHFKQLPVPYRVLYFQVCTALIVESVGAYIGLVLGQHNIWLFNCYFLIEAWFVSIPPILLIGSKKLKQASWGLLSIIMLVWCINIYYTGINVPANWYFLFFSVSTLSIYLFLLFDSGIFNARKLTQQPLFWMALSALIYFACMIPYKGFEKYLFANDMKMARLLFNINIGLGFLRYLFLAISFYLLGKGSKKNTLDKPNAN